MTIALTSFLSKLNNLIGDNITGTTDSAGSTDKTTLVDSSLSRYEDGYFGDPERNTQWWVYVSSQLRPIKKFISASGTISVFKAFSSQIATSTAYELHRFDRDQKIIAINQALYDAYPYFYKRIEDATTLTGKGPSDTEYTVPATFIEFPDLIYEKYASGTTIYYTPITDYDVKEINGTMKFYANITDDYPILLIGKTYLTQFTNDASTTELTNAQAEAICFLAATIFYRNISGVVNAADSGRFDSLASRYELKWEERKLQDRMPLLAAKDISFDWVESSINKYAPGW